MRKELPSDIYILFIVLFIHGLLLLNQLSRPYFILLAVFNLTPFISSSLLVLELVIIVLVFLLFLRRIRWAEQLSMIFYTALLVNSILSFIPFIFLRLDLASYLRGVVSETEIFHIFTINLFANLIVYLLAMIATKRNRRYLRF